MSQLSKCAVGQSSGSPASTTSTLPLGEKCMHRCACTDMHNFRCNSMFAADAGADCMRRTLEWRSRARARATSCFWPADRGAPPSDSTRSRPRGVASTISDRCARRSAAQHSAALCSPNGVRLKRSVPVNSTGTCTCAKLSSTSQQKHCFMSLKCSNTSSEHMQL